MGLSMLILLVLSAVKNTAIKQRRGPMEMAVIEKRKAKDSSQTKIHMMYHKAAIVKLLRKRMRVCIVVG